jgi:cytochrome c-type biogenesis protein CcmH/NrfG
MRSDRPRSGSEGPLPVLAREVLTLELLWPFPLLAVGVLGILDPLMVGAAVVFAVLPWAARWFAVGALTRRAVFGGPLGLWLLGGLAGLWAAYDAGLSWPAWLTLLGSVSLFFAVVNSRVSPWRIAEGLVSVAALAALYFAGQYGHFEYADPGSRLGELWAQATGSLLPDLVAYAPHPNAAAGFLEGAFLMSLALAGRTRRWFWPLATAVVAFSLLLTGSRGAWAGLAAALTVWGWLRVRSRRLRLAGAFLGIAAIAGVVAMAARLAAAPGGALAAGQALNTLSSRFVLYRNSAHLLGDYLYTGIGPGDTFAMVYSRYLLIIGVPFLTYAHNLLLGAWLAYGMLGVAALAWLLIGFYTFVVRAELAGVKADAVPLFRAAWLGVTVTWLHGLIDAPQLSGARWTMPVLFALLGLTVVAGRAAAEQDAAPGRRAAGIGRRGWASLAIGAVVLLAAALVFWRPLSGAWFANLGSIYQTRADLAPDLDDAGRATATARAVVYFEQALGRNPDQPVASRRLGTIALERGDVEAAVDYLERAYRREPGNQAAVKLLGYAYLWTGRLDAAEDLFRQVEFSSELWKELAYWDWWWGEQGREDLSDDAEAMLQRLRDDR